jgi:TonB family protein
VRERKLVAAIKHSALQSNQMLAAESTTEDPMKLFAFMAALTLIAGCSSSYPGNCEQTTRIPINLIIRGDSAFVSQDSLLIQNLERELLSHKSSTNEPVTYEEPKVLSCILPNYPPGLQEIVDGRVTVKILLDKSGQPRLATVLTSSNIAFNAPSLNAAIQFRFSPGKMNGVSVSVWVSFPFDFKNASV